MMSRNRQGACGLPTDWLFCPSCLSLQGLVPGSSGLRAPLLKASCLALRSFNKGKATTLVTRPTPIRFGYAPVTIRCRP